MLYIALTIYWLLLLRMGWSNYNLSSSYSINSPLRRVVFSCMKNLRLELTSLCCERADPGEWTQLPHATRIGEGLVCYS
jgi:hypothetical protein